MAEWSRNKVDSSQLNNGNEFDNNSNLSLDEINAVVNGGLFSQDFTEHLADTPDTSEAGNVGTPAVSLVDNIVGDKTFKKFKFSNMKGEQGHGYYRYSGALTTSSTSCNTSSLQFGDMTKVLLSDTIVDSNGLYFAVTADTEKTASTVPISYRGSIKGDKGDKGDQGDKGVPIMSTQALSYSGSAPTNIENFIILNQYLSATPKINDTMAIWIIDINDNLFLAIGTCVSISGSGDFIEVTFNGTAYKLDSGTIAYINNTPQKSLYFNSDPQTQINKKLSRQLTTHCEQKIINSWKFIDGFIPEPEHIWTDGENIYYSWGSQYVLNKTTSTWEPKTWNGEGAEWVSGSEIWTDGENIYCSTNGKEFVLDVSTNSWNPKTFNWPEGKWTYGGARWTDGGNIYTSYDSAQYVLNKTTSTWEPKTWNGFTSFYSSNIWTDGENIYYSQGSAQYVLNKTTSTWEPKTWNVPNETSDKPFSLFGNNIWSDGENIYLSSSISSGGETYKTLSILISPKTTKI